MELFSLNRRVIEIYHIRSAEFIHIIAHVLKVQNLDFDQASFCNPRVAHWYYRSWHDGSAYNWTESNTELKTLRKIGRRFVTKLSVLISWVETCCRIHLKLKLELELEHIEPFGTVFQEPSHLDQLKLKSIGVLLWTYDVD